MSALTLVGTISTGIALVIAAQLGAMTSDLPRYELNVRGKITRVPRAHGRPHARSANESPRDHPRLPLRARSESLSQIQKPHSSCIRTSMANSRLRS